jgi:acetyl esterase/lipase
MLVELKYGSHPQQGVDVYHPVGTAKAVIVWVHGGAWITGDRKEHKLIGQSFAERGFICAVMGYITEKGTQFPQPLVDIACGLELLVQHYSTHVYLCGHSAGAQIASMLALAGTCVSIAAVVGVEGIYDIDALAKSHPKFVPWFLDIAFKVEDRVKASPQFAKCVMKPDFAIIYSHQDEYEMLDQSLAFHRKLLQDGILVEYTDQITGTHDGILQNVALFDYIDEFISKRCSK